MKNSKETIENRTATFRLVPQCLKRHRAPQRHRLPWLNFCVFSQSLQTNVVMVPQNLTSRAMASCYMLSVSSIVH